MYQVARSIAEITTATLEYEIENWNPAEEVAELMAALPASLERLQVGGKLWQPTELFRVCSA